MIQPVPQLATSGLATQLLLLAYFHPESALYNVCEGAIANICRCFHVMMSIACSAGLQTRLLSSEQTSPSYRNLKRGDAPIG